jgi:uncharacterized protein YegP (UPF0339 family)
LPRFASRSALRTRWRSRRASQSRKRPTWLKKRRQLVFEVYEDSGGSYRYRIKDGEHNIGMASKGYDTKAEVQKIIKAIQDGAAKAKVVDVKPMDAKSK